MRLQVLAAAAAALVLGSTGALATEFELTLAGSGEVFDYYRGPQPNGDPYWPTYWDGDIRVTTAGSADGVYTGAGLEAIDVYAYFFTLGYVVGDTQTIQYGSSGQEWLVGMEPGATAVVSDGRVTSLTFQWDWPFAGGVAVNGLSMTADGTPIDSPTAGDMRLSGTLTPVPEGEASAMLMAGLALLGAFVKRSRLRAGTRQPH